VKACRVNKPADFRQSTDRRPPRTRFVGICSEMWLACAGRNVRVRCGFSANACTVPHTRTEHEVCQTATRAGGAERRIHGRSGEGARGYGWWFDRPSGSSLAPILGQRRPVRAMPARTVLCWRFSCLCSSKNRCRARRPRLSTIGFWMTGEKPMRFAGNSSRRDPQRYSHGGRRDISSAWDAAPAGRGFRDPAPVAEP